VCGACPPGSCRDGIRNQNEEGVDCGGVCGACPDCFDGIKNQNEEWADCGGACQPCPTCSDDVQNGDETGVDCGGACRRCLPSPTGALTGFIVGLGSGGGNGFMNLLLLLILLVLIYDIILRRREGDTQLNVYGQQERPTTRPAHARSGSETDLSHPTALPTQNVKTKQAKKKVSKK